MTHAIISEHHRLVLIEWRDSYGVGAEWQEVRSIPDLSPLVCVSVGYVIAESAEAICVAPHIHPDDDAIGAVKSACGDMTIPKCAITRMVELEA